MSFISLSFLLALLVQQISSFRLLQSSGRSTRTFAVPTVEVVGERVFASYVVYKSKAAVSLKIIPPTFQPAGVNAKKLSREGGLFFEFALAAGPKEYDWLKKGTFFLSAAECAEMLLLSQGKQGMELFHDPNMGAANSGQITKKLKFQPTADEKGLFLSLAVNDKNTQSMSYSVPVSWGEMKLIQTLASYSIPRFLGFDQVWDNPTVALTEEDSR